MDPKQINKFIQDGWVIVDIPQVEIIHEYVSMLEKKMRDIIGVDCSLSNLHNFVDDETFKNLHTMLAEYFWLSEFSIRLGKEFLIILKEILGLDVMVQYRPYLRLARPGKYQDNIGFHRDTQYGQTPYELAVHIPFVDLDEHASLKIVSGSHRFCESVFPIIKDRENHIVKKGSMEHQLGKPYSPKQLALPKGVVTEPLSLRVGQAALFSPALFHGQEVNCGKVTRVTTDMRFVNQNANLNLKIGKTHTGYVPISYSPIQKLAQEYYQAQKETV